MIIINPGTEPIEETDLNNAAANMKHLVTDIDSTHDIQCVYRGENNYGNGRYAFVLLDYNNNTFHEIQMPGVPLGKVRYMNEPGQKAWDFPRLYVDGSSWLWMFAAEILKEEFSKEEDEE